MKEQRKKDIILLGLIYMEANLSDFEELFFSGDDDERKGTDGKVMKMPTDKEVCELIDKIKGE